MSESIIALIPARAGSRRVPHKNTRLLNGVPLLAYAVATALEADIFSAIVVSSDDPDTLEIARSYGATSLILRPAELATDDSPDIRWVRHAVENLGGLDAADAFCILRPTSPFRTGRWVRAAWDTFRNSGADSLRAMRVATEHPGKMWRMGRRYAVPLLPFGGTSAPWHSMPTQDLPRCYVQTAALEIAWMRVLPESISGETVLPWLGNGAEGIDINDERQWQEAERIAAENPTLLPTVAHDAMSVA